MSKKMKYVGEEPREIPQYGVYEPGVEVEYDKTLFNTGLFDVIKKKEGDK
jgi:hypothetical protein